MNGRILFADFDLGESLRKQTQDMINEVNSWDSDYILSTPLGDLMGYLLAKHIVEAPRLLEDQIETTVKNTVIDSTDQFTGRSYKLLGTEFRFHLSFEGDEHLFQFSPSTFSHVHGQAIIEGHQLIFVHNHPHAGFEGADREALIAKQNFEAWLKSVQQNLAWMATDLAIYRQELQQKAQSQLDFRHQKALRERQMAASLGYPLKRRDGEQVRKIVPLARRAPVVPKPIPSKGVFQPEFELDMAEYEFILSVLEHMTVVIERSPQRLGMLSEETLRDILLITLNGHYEGSATSETFNVSGKTDILIRADGKNIFIAECKFWGGAKLLQETIDQLLGYISWRDTKIAIILFNRNKDFTGVIRQIPEIMQAHANYKRRLEISGEARSRYVFHQPNDANREVILTVLAFDVAVN